MPFDRTSLILPDGTQVQERAIVLPKGDAVVADEATVEFALLAPGNVFVGERADLGGVVAEGDVRVDLWTRVRGDVSASGSVYLGERVQVEGKLTVAQDLDVGNDVRLEKGFEARGWINIRNPLPLVMYVFVYLLQMLRQGRSEEVDRVLKELERLQDDATELVVADVFLYVPKGTRMSLAETVLPGALAAGAACRLVGNHRVGGDARLGSDAILHGSLHAHGDVHLAVGAEVTGDVESDGVVHLAERARVRGSVRARRIEMRTTALVEGTLHADEGVKLVTPASLEAERKVEDFEAGRGDVGRIL